jgi:predicted O-methyltransferase YrrM
MNVIRESSLFNERIQFETNDTSANMGPLDFFSLSTKHFTQILCLDTECVVLDDINKVFDRCEDLLYVGPENIETRVLLFENSQTIQELFETMKQNPNHKCFDNQALRAFVGNDVSDDRVIYCFPESIYPQRIEYMNRFLSFHKDKTIDRVISIAKSFIDEHLLPLIHRSGEKLEGNIFMLHHQEQYSEVFIDKVKNITNLLLNKQIKQVMEIGFNSGFSTLLMLLTNPHVRIHCFDLGEHAYTLPCFEKLKEYFGDRVKITLGDSTKTLPWANHRYDLIHIDGGHTREIAKSDVLHSYRLSKKGTILIMDDYDCCVLHELWNHYVQDYTLKTPQIQLYPCPYHDIKYV